MAGTHLRLEDATTTLGAGFPVLLAVAAGCGDNVQLDNGCDYPLPEGDRVVTEGPDALLGVIVHVADDALSFTYLDPADAVKVNIRYAVGPPGTE